MTRVGIDAQIATMPRSGIGRFAAELCACLPRVDSNAEYVEFKPHDTTKDFNMPQRWWWDQVTLPRRATRERANVLLKPAFSCPVRSPVPVVIVLHDLVAKLFPEQFNRPSAWFFGRWTPWTLRFATRVVAASEHTAADARRLLKIPDGRIRVVTQGVDGAALAGSSDDTKQLARFSLPERYILHVGTIEPRKNLAFLVRAFAGFLKRRPEYALVLAGHEGWKSDDVRSTVQRLRLERAVRFVGGVSSGELSALYRNARVLAYPTRYEGFGRPPLEAMAAGTPVVAARTSSIPEVVGDAGILLSGYDEGQWADALTLAAEDAATRSRLQAKGRERSRMFTWERTARMIADICHEVAHG